MTRGRAGGTVLGAERMDWVIAGKLKALVAEGGTELLRELAGCGEGGWVLEGWHGGAACRWWCRQKKYRSRWWLGGD